MNYVIHYVSLFMILFSSVVFADEGEVNAPGSSPLAELKTISKQSLNLAVQGDDVEMAICTMDNLTQADGGIQTQGTEFVLRESQSDNLGYKHIRLEQRYKGLPVVGAECIVHINNQNVIYRINGKYLPDFKISVKPDIDADAALQIGLEEHKSKAGLQVERKTSLVIYGRHLAYHYVVSYEDAEPGQWWYYIDAHTGKLIYRYNNIQYGVPKLLDE